jgi:hypothetical protein
MNPLKTMIKGTYVQEIYKAMGFKDADELNAFFGEDNKRYADDGYVWGPRTPGDFAAGVPSSPWTRNLLRRQRLLTRALAGEVIPREAYKIPRDENGDVLEGYYSYRIWPPPGPAESEMDKLRRLAGEKLRKKT